MKTRRPRITHQIKMDITLFIKEINLEEDRKKQERIRWDNQEIYALATPCLAREISKNEYIIFKRAGVPTEWVLYSGKRWEIRKEIKEKFGHRLTYLNK